MEERKANADVNSSDISSTTGVSSGALGGTYRHKEAKNVFPFSMLYKMQDQMDEIVDIDTNHVLDMYVTLSRDGTIALRCMRTSRLWQHFLLMSKLEL